MADENTPVTPETPQEPAASDWPDTPETVSGEQVSDSVGADDDAGLEPEPKSKAAYSMEARERVRFLDWLGIDGDEAIALYHRMRLSRVPLDRALRGASGEDRLMRLRQDVDAKLRSLPRFAYPEFRKRRQVRQSMKISSEVFMELGEDADELMNMLGLSGEIIAGLVDLLDDQMRLHEELSGRLDAVRFIEDKAVYSPPEWTIELARMIEALGFDRKSIRSKGRPLVDGFRRLLEEHGTPAEGLEETFDRMAERAVHSIDGAPDDDDFSVEDQTDLDDTAAFPLDAAIPVPFDGEVPSVSVSAIPNVVTETPSSAPTGRTAEAFFAGSIGAKTSSETTAADIRSGGFAEIEGLENEDRFGGVFSQFERGEASPLAASGMARMEEREGFQLRKVKVVNGILPDAAWMRYEVPYGDYVLVQMKGASSVLPRLQNAAHLAYLSAGLVSGMFPPFASMERFGEMVGASEMELRSLAAWDAPGTGGEPMRPSILDGGRGDPAQAYEVMMRAVAIHLSSVLGADEAGRIASVTIDHMARFWLFLTVGRMRPSQLELMWPGGFFHGVEGHDVGVGNNGYMRLLRRRSGSIDASIA
ncbi:MAG: hypothetical protein DI591_10850 [Citromicrobium sp.]|nr:MAG: hypothetical protein DI591_10850 [Citromicrobium sp.]